MGDVQNTLCSHPQKIEENEGGTMRGTAFHSANMLSTQVLKEVKGAQEMLLQALEEK